ncbi:ATPase AAA [Actinoplanes cyaneus]|uniref:ATPase AAA n=1 Tax=Actinoplanes cyaneus TaxID=52696 RepID=A0A919M976_9ACTN|nr:AAA family ATPase [Actinoplanes cyaneus]MCW2143789.1 MoxR-like ATPase [Actinoplanes cyaneus]GID70582.1 ATPase AAA [Actinoplanes cyaneus]
MNQRYADTITALGTALIARVPALLWGPPGQGKTSVIESLGDDLHFHVETVIASLHEPADFAGLPMLDPSNSSTRLLPPAWARRVAAMDRPSVVFYDEISTTPPATQAALLRPILTGWVGDLRLPEGTCSVAAANPPEIAADGWDLAPPLANRFVHLDWTLPADVVRDGFTVGWPRVPVPSVALDLVDRATVSAKTLVGTFLRARPELVTRMPSSSEQAGRAFPTPRSWEMGARLYGAAKAAGFSETVVLLLLNGSVGTAAAAEFLEFVRRLDLPDPETLLKDPSAYVVPVRRADQVFATAAAVVTAMTNDPTPDRWLACGTILAAVADAGMADIAFLFARRWSEPAVRPFGVLPTADQLRALGPILTEIHG